MTKTQMIAADEKITELHDILKPNEKPVLRGFDESIDHYSESARSV
jgi:hypothetical protein